MGRVGSSCTIFLFRKNDIPRSKYSYTGFQRQARWFSLSESRLLKIDFSDIRRYLSVKVTLLFRHLEYSTQPIMELCDRFMMMLPANMAMKLNEILPFQLMLFLLVLSCPLYTYSCKSFHK